MSHAINTGDILLEIDDVDVANDPLSSLVCHPPRQPPPPRHDSRMLYKRVGILLYCMLDLHAKNIDGQY